ncbi:hypothetical protein ACOSP7_013265 [Xanthoceras sorbifolium]
MTQCIIQLIRVMASKEGEQWTSWQPISFMNLRLRRQNRASTLRLSRHPLDHSQLSSPIWTLSWQPKPKQGESLWSAGVHIGGDKTVIGELLADGWGQEGVQIGGEYTTNIGGGGGDEDGGGTDMASKQLRICL